MNDYLHNLAAKTVRAVPLIEPRLASVFEPSSQFDLTIAADETTASATAQVEAEAVNDTTAANQGRAEKFESEIKAQLLPREADQFSQRTVLPLRANDKALQVADSAPQPARAESQLPEPSLFRSAEELTADPESVESSANENAQAAAIQIRPSVAPLVAGRQADEVMKAGTATSQTEQESAPVIRISIGRVEVRAVMPTAPAPRTAPARPRPGLSLDDYLREREGGKR
ncbi:MAG: hypothetical protein U0Z53_30520 [Blastocatellia bacterium]